MFEEAQFREQFRQEKEVFPTKVEPLVREIEGKRVLQEYIWGLKNIKVYNNIITKPVINATFEKLLKIKMWSVPLINKRCIVPASSYTEWKELDNKRRDRYEIYYKDKNLIGFPGLICPFIDDNGNETEGFVIITMPANEHVSFVHHRQPGLILEKDYEAWLDTNNKNPEKAIHYVENEDYHYTLTKAAPPLIEKSTRKKRNKNDNQLDLFQE